VRPHLLRQARQRAAKLGIDFDLTLADIVVPERCPALGVELSVGKRHARPHSPSLDRIDPSLGYVRGNVVVVSHRANSIKNDASIDELKRVLEFYQGLARIGEGPLARRDAA
jgi:hypothetical protein